MSGVKGLLDDAHEIAVKLHRILDDIAAAAETQQAVRERQWLVDDADDLANRIDNLRTQVRS